MYAQSEQFRPSARSALVVSLEQLMSYPVNYILNPEIRLAALSPRCKKNHTVAIFLRRQIQSRKFGANTFFSALANKRVENIICIISDICCPQRKAESTIKEFIER